MRAKNNGGRRVPFFRRVYTVGTLLFLFLSSFLFLGWCFSLSSLFLGWCFLLSSLFLGRRFSLSSLFLGWCFSLSSLFLGWCFLLLLCRQCAHPLSDLLRHHVATSSFISTNFWCLPLLLSISYSFNKNFSIFFCYWQNIPLGCFLRNYNKKNSYLLIKTKMNKENYA